MLSPISGFNITPTRVRVYKTRSIGCEHCRPVMIEKPWNVIAPYWPNESFATLEEAMAHARKWRPPILMNAGFMSVDEVRRREDGIGGIAA